MKVTLMQTNRKVVITLPIVNDDISWGKGHNHQTVETINNGEILIPGRRKLIDVSISSFLPSNESNKKKYKFSKSSMQGEKIVTYIEKWRDKRTPIRLIISTDSGKTLLNILVLIEHFERGLDKASDIPYTLKLKQYIELEW